MNAAEIPVDDLVRQFRRWAGVTSDPHVQAAVGLLIAHDHWVRAGSFRAVLIPHDGMIAISWSRAREAFDAGDFAPASSTELAVLDFAIALGEDRYRLSRMGRGNAGDIAYAVRRALNTP